MLYDTSGHGYKQLRDFLEKWASLKTTSEVLVATCLFVTIYIIIGLVYRLFISPLSKFPGPKLAAATLWYEFYYDAVLKGQYTFRIKEMHLKYGPIVRVSPYELHIDDPDYYSMLYAYSAPLDKNKYYLEPFDFPLSAFGTESHHLHRLRRGAMNPFFSSRRVAQHEDLIHRLADKLCGRIEEFQVLGKNVPLSLGYICLGTDLITSYVLDENYQCLDATEWLPHWARTLKSLSTMVMVSRQLTWILPLLKRVPQSWAIFLDPGLELFLILRERCCQIIDEIHQVRATGALGMEGGLLRGYTLIDQVLDSRLTVEEKSHDRLLQEVRSTMAAGIETTANTLTGITYYLLANPEKLRSLQDELRMLDWDTDVKAQELEKLPYLTSVILEGLRLSYGVSTRLQRKSRSEAIQYKTFSIPPSTSVGMTSVLMHHHEAMFPDSYKFIPERWLDPKERKRLQRYLVSFGKGSRRCVGQRLAQTTLLITIASLFKRFELELKDTSEDDINIGRDLFVPRPKDTNSIGLQVAVKSEI
ncbi:hypothetical protein ACO22_05937 [Paracoccidioides brasiliensis]|uniref:Cytochrome P450 n=1 Tax=Paracoccidioides brasiliensis TaxID=121759 RepID=A0A1D2J8W6_PARBR|nr:hypothetical protein ACO22_05937 [Paracoccidioides brasiliensis]